MAYDYCKELREKYYIDELNSETLSYRINGFTNNCNMDLGSSECIKEVSPFWTPYINKSLDEDGLKYNINFARSYDEKGKYFIMVGKYNDLDLMFINYFEKDRNKEKINEIPFKIVLNTIGEYNYSMEIETVKGKKTRFSITKSKEGETLPNTLTFYSTIKDFDIVLEIVRHFVTSPQIVHAVYSEVMNVKEVNFSNKDINVLIKK